MSVLAAIAFLLLGPLSVLAFGGLDLDTHWSAASRESTGQAPSPQAEPAAVVQVYGARTYSWRGAFGIHTWIAAKRSGADHYAVYHVVGWNLYRGGSAVTVGRTATPDFRWFNAWPQVLADRRGPDVDELIDRIEAAVADYPWPDRYRAWPGPNSNTFTAYVARRVPELRLDLPPHALGKDWLGDDRFFAPMPSGTGWQASLFGLAGVGVALDEGFELNLLGLSVGVDVDDFALRLPGIGWVGPGR